MRPRVSGPRMATSTGAVGEKAPKQKDWQNLAITLANVADYFEQNQDIGLQLGDDRADSPMSILIARKRWR